MLKRLRVMKMSKKPTVFNYEWYEKAVDERDALIREADALRAENTKLKARIANLEIMLRIKNED